VPVSVVQGRLSTGFAVADEVAQEGLLLVTGSGTIAASMLSSTSSSNFNPGSSLVTISLKNKHIKTNKLLTEAIWILEAL